MTNGMRGRGFFAGAIGGLALALLLVGVVSYLPQPNAARQALSSPAKDVGQGSWGAANSAQTTASTTTAGAAYLAASHTSSTSAGSPPAGIAPVRNSSRAPATSSSTTVPPAINVNPVTATTTVTGGVATTTVAGPELSTTTAANASNALAGVSGGSQQRPNSLLTVLPGESVENLIATLSPLLVALLVAVLIYSAYSRRQDSSS